MVSRNIRIEEMEHAAIMKAAGEYSRTAGEIVAMLVRKYLEEGERPLAPVKTRSRTRRYEDPKYGLSVDQYRGIPARIPPGVHPDKAGVAPPENLAVELKELAAGSAGEVYWMHPTHSMTRALGFIAGCAAEYMQVRAGIIPVLRDMRDYELQVMEECGDVFIPVNDTASRVMLAIGAAARDVFTKHYLTSADLYVLWLAGFTVKYAEGV